jgi:hypothetical protein
MSLRKKLAMTEKKISVNQANGRRSHGAANPEGRDRIPVADWAPINPRAVLILRMEDFNFRQVWPLPTRL